MFQTPSKHPVFFQTRISHFHSLFRAPRWYGKRIEKSGAKKPHGSWGETGIENGAAKNWLFAIYMGKPVGSRVGQMVSKIQDW